MSEEKENTNQCTSVQADELREKRENRRIKHWAIRWLIKFATGIVSLIVLAVLYGYVFQERELEAELATGVLNNVFTVLKFLFE